MVGEMITFLLPFCVCGDFFGRSICLFLVKRNGVINLLKILLVRKNMGMTILKAQMQNLHLSINIPFLF